MSKTRDLERLDYIAEKIMIIFEICETQGGVTRALEDFKMARAAMQEKIQKEETCLH